MKCVKWLLKILVILGQLSFMVSGIVAASAGTLALIVAAETEPVLSLYSLKVCMIGLILLGVLFLCVSFLGFTGVAVASYKLLVAGISLSALLLFLQICALIFVLAGKNTFENIRSEAVTVSMQNFDNYDFIKTRWDEIHTGLQCCGMQNFTDWTVLGKIPTSCCKVQTPLCSDGALGLDQARAAESIFTDGCFDKLLHETVFGYWGTLVLIISVQIFSSLFSVCLAHSIEKTNE